MREGYDGLGNGVMPLHVTPGAEGPEM
jgi:hypothetical protein